MRREQLTEKILDLRRANGWTWKHVCSEIGGIAPTLIVGALLGQMKLVKPLARRAAALFGLSAEEEAMLNEVPHRGTEEFGDGIMSAIDFNFELEREPNPKGDRVRITMSGKFLPYKYYGNEPGIPEYGFKE